MISAKSMATDKQNATLVVEGGKQPHLVSNNVFLFGVHLVHRLIVSAAGATALLNVRNGSHGEPACFPAHGSEFVPHVTPINTGTQRNGRMAINKIKQYSRNKREHTHTHTTVTQQCIQYR